MAKPQTVPPTPADAADPAPTGKKKSKRMIVIAAVALLALGGGGGGAWYYFGSGTHADAKPAEKKPPVFLSLEPFTVNLLPEEGDRYLQTGIVFQVADEKAIEAMKTYMPIIRNRILLLLSGKRPSDLTAPDGKQKLVAELILAARESVPGGRPDRGIDSAYLASFVIQ